MQGSKVAVLHGRVLQPRAGRCQRLGDLLAPGTGASTGRAGQQVAVAAHRHAVGLTGLGTRQRGIGLRQRQADAGVLQFIHAADHDLRAGGAQHRQRVKGRAQRPGRLQRHATNRQAQRKVTAIQTPGQRASHPVDVRQQQLGHGA